MIIKDKIMPGIMVGLLADVIKLTVNYIGYFFGYTSVVFWQITATRFLDKRDLFKPLAYIIGGIADITVSALLGIVFIYFIYVFGNRHLWVKGAGFGLIIWVGLFGTLLGESVQAKLPQSPLGIFVTIAAHFFFGLALAFFTMRLEYSGDNDVSIKTNSDQKQKADYLKLRLTPPPARKIQKKTKKLRKPNKIQ